MPHYIQKAHIEEGVDYVRAFSWRSNPSAGFGFPCNEKGEVDPSMAPIAHENLRMCLDGTFDVVDDGVKERLWRIRHRSIIACEDPTCSGEISLRNFTNTCVECGADYNMSGSRLAPREQWGEETGEHWSECV